MTDKHMLSLMWRVTSVEVKAACITRVGVTNLEVATKCQGIRGQAALLSLSECGGLALSSKPQYIFLTFPLRHSVPISGSKIHTKSASSLDYLLQHGSLATKYHYLECG